MHLTRLFCAFLAIFYSAQALEVIDIFSQELIREAEVSPRHEDFGLNIYKFLEKYGYPVESHEVTTEDGYILTMQRIPHGRNETDLTTKKPAILLMHGLLCSAMDFVNMGPESALALNLADAGYDVWLGNNRGNTWSRRHVTLDPDVDKEEFWDFSFDNCGNYDLPAKIDYIINATGHEKINYIAHSQGTTQFFSMAASKPEYNEKINLMIALAPVAYMHNLSQPLIRFVANYTSLLDLVMKEIDFHELLPHTEFVTEVIQILCHDGSDFQEMCAGFFSFIVGDDSAQLNRSFLEVIGSNVPAGISYKMISHYLQEINSGYFRKYDYGIIKNLEKYQALTPPVYDTSLITAPVALFYAKNDLLSAVSNVEQLADELPNLVKKNLMEYEKFNHLDFIWAIDIKTLLNNDVIALIDEYNSMS